MGKKIRYVPLDLSPLPSFTQARERTSETHASQTIGDRHIDQGRAPHLISRANGALSSKELSATVPLERVDSNFNTTTDEDRCKDPQSLSTPKGEYRRNHWKRRDEKKGSLREKNFEGSVVRGIDQHRLEKLDKANNSGYVQSTIPLEGQQQSARPRNATPTDEVPSVLPIPPPTPSVNSSIEALKEKLSKLCLASRRALPPPSLTIIPSAGAAHSLPPRPPPSSLNYSQYPPTPSTPWTPGYSPTLPIRPPRDPTLHSRKRVKDKVIPGKVYYIPDGRYIPESIIHGQRCQDGFFKHPALVVEVEGDIAFFYALTKAPPRSIRQLKMCLPLGTTTTNENFDVLKLADGSAVMLTETWVNLEQRFFIEWKNLDEWAIDVRVDPKELCKVWKRVQELEADQNRYIYKPLLRDMSLLQPGTVVMMPNDSRSSTVGSPVVILVNEYPRFQFLRIKQFDDNIHFNSAATKANGSSPARCLEISKQPKMGHEGTPIMLLEPDSPSMRELSYVDVSVRAKTGRLEHCKTWCWPPVKIRQQSMRLLFEYMSTIASSFAGTSEGTLTESQPSSRASSVLPPPTPLGWSVDPGTPSFVGGFPYSQGATVLLPQMPPHNGHGYSANASYFHTPPHTPFNPHFPAPSGNTDPVSYSYQNQNLLHPSLGPGMGFSGK